MNKAWKEAYEHGKSIQHAVKTIGNKHLIYQIGMFQDGLRSSPMNDSSKQWVKELELFRSGIEMSGTKLSKELKSNIISYCDSAIKYHKSVSENTEG